MAKVAVVILNYNGENYLKEFLPSVIHHSGSAEIIVADNASTDQSVQTLKNTFPMVTLLEFGENYGFAGGYNNALSQIEADYYVLLNSDVEVTPGWLDPLINFLENNPDYAACQPKIKDFNNKTKFEYAGASGGFIDSFGYPYCRGRIFDTLEDDHKQYDDPVDIFWSSGACTLIRSHVFHACGAFDKDFFAHMEEIDLCWRIHSAGFKIKSIPSSEVYHVGGGTLSKSSPFKTYLNFRNGLYLLLKNLPLLTLFYKFPIRILLDWVAALKFLLEGGFLHSLAILKAHFSTMVSLFRTINKRKHTSALPKSTILIVQYYLKKKKRFSEL